MEILTQEIVQMLVEGALAAMLVALSILLKIVIEALKEARPEIIHYIRVKAGQRAAEHIDQAITVAVRAAHDERVTGVIEDTGLRAYEEALRIAQREAALRGYKLDYKELDAGVRAKYQELKQQLDT